MNGDFEKGGAVLPSIFVLGKDNEFDTIGITGGPSDLDLWLCLRGTIGHVTFFLDRNTTYPQFHENNRRSFLPARIFSMKYPTGDPRSDMRLTGYTFSGNYRYFFKMSYGTRDRKGLVWFPNRGAVPK